MRSKAVTALLLACFLTSCPGPRGKGREDAAAPEPERAGLPLARLFEDPPLDGVSLREVHWTEDGSKVGFLRPMKENRDVLEMWVYDVGAKEARPLVRADDIVKDVVLTQEQIQELERKRITQRGVTGYVWSPDGRSLLFPLGEDLYLYSIESGQAARLETEGAPLDPDFSPDGQRISYVAGGEIWVLPIAGGPARKLTKGATETLTHGLAEFVAEEEMARYRGYWWSPDGTRIAYIEVDEGAVEVWRRARYEAGASSFSEQRYPAAGKPNARTRLGLLDTMKGWTTWVDLGEDAEYIARVDWGPGGRFLAVQTQTRDQRTLRLLRVNPATAKASVLLEETAKTFVNLHDDLRLLEDGRFIWSSERSGTRQLYLYTEDGKLMREITDHDLPVVAVAGVDETRGSVLYSAVTNKSLEQHLFRAGIDKGDPVQITSEPGWHEAEASKDGLSVVDVHSSLIVPPRAFVLDREGKRIAVLEDNPTPDLASHIVSEPEFLEVMAADQTTALNAVMLRPAGFDPGRRYPVVIEGYGGPGGREVIDRWSRGMLWRQVLASRGYIVFSVDPRGSAHRGKAFEDAIHERFGVVEVVDHRAAVEHLRTLPYVDPERIGIWGWSYGGTLVLMSLLETEGFYRCGIAVAPVTDWHYYDTHYTERFLGMPDRNAGIYSAASPVDKEITGLKERLLVVHGMADDNVFLGNTLAFIQRLQDAGIQFDLMLYPGKTHFIAGKSTRSHLYSLMLGFIEENLGSRPPSGF